MYCPEQDYTWYFDEPILKYEVIECCECGQIIPEEEILWEIKDNFYCQYCIEHSSTFHAA